MNGSAKGWAGVIRFNPQLLHQFSAFRDRADSFSLGVCNGCQLMALLGWVPFPGDSIDNPLYVAKGGEQSHEFADRQQMRFVHNDSGRFESRWCAVKVQWSPSVLLKGMEGSTLGELYKSFQLLCV